MELAGLRLDAAFARAQYGLSERRACQLLGLDRTTCRYAPAADHNAALRAEMIALARQKPRYGYRRLGVLLERKGLKASGKRLYRLYRQEGLAVRRQRRKRWERPDAAAPRLTRPNQEWALDFVSDGIATGRGIRILAVVDAYTRECLAREVDTSLPSRRVTRVLERVVAERGTPEAIRCDNGPELTSRHRVGGCAEQGVPLTHSAPGKPMQNGHVESFNGRFRDECRNAGWLENLLDARRKIAAWKDEYNGERPHSSLGYRTPQQFAEALRTSAMNG